MLRKSKLQDNEYSVSREAWKRFSADPLAVLALIMLTAMLVMALAAPLLANPRPLLAYSKESGMTFPFLRSFFAPESTEYFIEQLFNWLLLISIPLLAVLKIFRTAKSRITAAAVIMLLAALPFLLTSPKLERVDYRNQAVPEGAWRIMAYLPYGPFEQIADPLLPPDRQHPLGCDELGRDLAVRIIYGSRISLAVGVIATSLAMIIGAVLGIFSGFKGGWYDILLMRLVEILMCFPVFLLLLIIMGILQDHKFEQSILAVIGVIAATGWIGMAQLTRGEVLKQREMVYIKSAQALGVSGISLLFRHILPNILGMVMITFSFGVAGAILSESALSFLGFGVQPPTASWGGMLRSAFGDPLSAWHMTLFPGLMLFWAVTGFNLLGEGLRKAFDPKSQK